MRNKILLSLAIIFIAATVFTACEKETEIIEQKQSEQAENIQINMPVFAVEDNILYFDKLEDYDALLNAWANISFDKLLEIQNKLGFESMYEVYKKENNLDALPPEDPFLALILSPEGEIIIENYKFTFNFDKQKVTAENIQSKTIETFGFDDDVTDYLFNGGTITKSACDYRKSNVWVENKYEGWIKYYNAVIYKSLYTQFNTSGSAKSWSMCQVDQTWYNASTDPRNIVKITVCQSSPSPDELYQSIYKGSKLYQFHLKIKFTKVNYSTTYSETATLECL